MRMNMVMIMLMKMKMILVMDSIYQIGTSWESVGICVEPNSNIVLAYASTHILVFILANLFIYMVFYLTMKLLCGERPTNWVQTIVFAVFEILTSNC